MTEPAIDVVAGALKSLLAGVPLSEEHDLALVEALGQLIESRDDQLAVGMWACKHLLDYVMASLTARRELLLAMHPALAAHTQRRKPDDPRQ